jgi:phage shock protein C
MKHEHENKNIKRLYRSNVDKVIGGVCGGLGEYLEVDPVILRIIWTVLGLVGIGIIAYIIAWIIIPRNPDSSK